MSPHSSSWLGHLLDVAAGSGGGRMVIIGDAARPGRGGAPTAYWAGARFDAVESLFEAVLRPLLAAPYERIVAFTGQGLDHLPKSWKLGSTYHLGDDAFIWVARGQAPPPRTQAKEETPFGYDVRKLRTVAQINRLLWRASGLAYWDRVEELIARRDSEIEGSRAKGQRTALIIDDRFLRPTPFEWQVLSQNLGLEQRRAVSITRTFPLPADLGSTDVFVLAEDGLVTEMLDAGGNYIAAVLMTISGKEWEHHRSAIEPIVPKLSLGGGVTSTKAQRRELPYRATQLTYAAATAPSGARAYDVLRGARLEARSSTPELPAEPQLVALDFWANLDLTPLARAFSEEIIGQEETTRGILSLLDKYRDRCRRLLAMDANATRTSADVELRPPVINLFGAAGMGKTTICEIMGRELFGDERFSTRINLSDRRLATLTIGVNAPYVGWDQETMLIQFARETRGLGLLCFDELARVEVDQGKPLAEALSPLLEILESRSFLPTNPIFRPPEKRYYMSNTIFVFAGNIISQADQLRRGYVRIEDLGEPLRRRLSRDHSPFIFETLKPTQYREAFRRAVLNAARSYARVMARKHEHLVTDALVEESLLDTLVASFESQLSASGETPSLALLAAAAERLQLHETFQRAIRSNAPHLVIGLETLEDAEVRS